MEIMFDDKLEEVVVYDEQQLQETQEDNEVVSAIEEALEQSLSPVAKLLSAELPLVAKIAIAVIAAIVILLLGGLAGGLLYGLYSLIAPYLAQLLPFALPELTLTTFLCLAAVAIVAIIGYVVYNSWGWIKQLPKAKREKMLNSVTSVASTVKNVWTDGSRNLELD